MSLLPSYAPSKTIQRPSGERTALPMVMVSEILPAGAQPQRRSEQPDKQEAIRPRVLSAEECGERGKDEDLQKAQGQDEARRDGEDQGEEVGRVGEDQGEEVGRVGELSSDEVEHGSLLGGRVPGVFAKILPSCRVWRGGRSALPATCRYLPFWQEVLHDPDLEVHLDITDRHAAAVGMEGLPHQLMGSDQPHPLRFSPLGSDAPELPLPVPSLDASLKTRRFSET